MKTTPVTNPFPHLPDASLSPLSRWLSSTISSTIKDVQTRDCIRLTIALATHLYDCGHSCINIDSLANREFPSDIFFGIPQKENTESVMLPESEIWKSTLLKSGMCVEFFDSFSETEDTPDKSFNYYITPDGSFKVALTRFAVRDKTIALRLAELISNEPVAESAPCQSSLTDEQLKAVNWAVSNRFTVITGGPGTGKTTTVANIVAGILAENPDVTVKMAAPSGKAAARLTESFHKEIEDLIPKKPDDSNTPVFEASTIHRLLQIGGDGRTPRRSANNPIVADAIIIDEASMISSELMLQLLNAISTDRNTKLVLLGDMFQLKSVEPGNILGTICRTALKKDSSLFSNSIHVLTKSFRFSEEKNVGRLATAVVKSDMNTCISELRNATAPLEWHQQWSPAKDGPELYEKLFKNFRTSDFSDPVDALDTFEKSRILCAVNNGEFGCDAINSSCSEWLRVNHPNPSEPQPIIILQNDYELRLFNGDTGIIMNSPSDKRERFAFFKSADEATGYRKFRISLLPLYAPAYAITIHKSQGSEYENVAVVLPPYKSNVVSRALVYTAITRFRERDKNCSLFIVASEAVLRFAIGRENEFDSLFPAAIEHVSELHAQKI